MGIKSLVRFFILQAILFCVTCFRTRFGHKSGHKSGHGCRIGMYWSVPHTNLSPVPWDIMTGSVATIIEANSRLMTAIDRGLNVVHAR